MKKPKITVVVLHNENKYFDVEVYEWNEETKTKGKELEKHRAYDLKNRNVLASYLERLEWTFELVETIEEREKDENDDDEWENALIPHLATYAFEQEELKVFLEKMVSNKHHIEVKIKIEFDSEYMNMYVDEETNEQAKEKMNDLYDLSSISWEDNLLQDVFESPRADYTVIMDDFNGDDVHIHVPFQTFMNKKFKK